jgi:hypothetical protein
MYSARHNFKYYGSSTYWTILLNPTQQICTECIQCATAVLFSQLIGYITLSSSRGANIVSNLPHFLVPEALLPYQNRPPRAPYPDLDESSPHQACFSRSVLIIFSHLQPSLLSDLSPAGFPTSTCIHFSFLPQLAWPNHFIILLWSLTPFGKDKLQAT